MAGLLGRLKDFRWFIVTGLAKGRPAVVGDKAAAMQGPSQGDLHGALRGFTLQGRRQESLNNFVQGSGVMCILARLFP